MRPHDDHITYREWRARGETVWGAFLRSVPYQYIWGPPVIVLAVLVVLVVLRTRSP